MRTPALARFGLTAVGLTAALAAGCTDDPVAAPAATTPTGPGASPACAVTLPRPVPAGEPWRSALYGSSSAYGNGKLWVGGLGPGGVIEVAPVDFEKDGSVGMKFGWWRAVPGPLRITGRRLDGAAPPVRSSVPDGYGDSGFHSSGVYFPTPGCWELTGQVGTTSLTFVTLVRSQT